MIWVDGQKLLAATCFLGLPVAVAILGYQLVSVSGTPSDHQVLLSLQKNMSEQSDQVRSLRQQAKRKLQALTLKASELQAKLVRLDAMGERLTVMANLDTGEFDFSQRPALGGPETQLEVSGQIQEAQSVF